MGVTIHVNGKSNSLVHKGSMGIAKSTLPDFCKTPSPAGPVPIPYPVIISMSNSLAKGTKTVKVDGKQMAAVKGSEFSRCNGDEPGTAGGVKSSTNMKEATWLLYSFDVKLDGKNACRLSDKMMMNHGNTVCLGGWLQAYVAANRNKSLDDACKALREYIDDMIGEGRRGKRGEHYPGRGLEERMNQNMGIGLQKGNEGFPPGTPEWDTHDDEIRKLQNDLGEKTDEFEDDCEQYNFRGKKQFLNNARDWQEKHRPTAADWQPSL